MTEEQRDPRQMTLSELLRFVAELETKFAAAAQSQEGPGPGRQGDVRLLLETLRALQRAQGAVLGRLEVVWRQIVERGESSEEA